MTVVNPAQTRHLSPFRFPGGKSWLVPTAREWLRQARPRELLEPFAGGASVGLAAAAEGLVKRVSLVELDEGIAAVWNVIVNASDRDAAHLAARIRTFDVTVEQVRRVIDTRPDSTVEQAFQTIVKNRCQRGGIMAAGAGLMKAGESGRGLSSRWYPDTLARRIETIRGFRHRLTFQQGDGFKAIPAFDGAAMFIDPPYTVGGKRAGSRLYTHSIVDHELLFERVAEYAGAALMTYDDAPEVRALAARHGFEVGETMMKNTHHRVMRELTLVR